MTNILVVDSETLIRDGLRALLSKADDIDVIGESGTGTDAIRICLHHQIDVVVLDIQLPDLNGLTATARLTALPCPPKVLVLTSLDAEQNVLQALDAGARGFLTKSATTEQIVNAVRLVASGGSAIMPGTLLNLLGEGRLRSPQRARAAHAKLAALNERQREILTFVGRGQSNAKIARALRMSEGTVKTYISRILSLLDVENRTQAALLVYDAGLLDNATETRPRTCG